MVDHTNSEPLLPKDGQANEDGLYLKPGMRVSIETDSELYPETYVSLVIEVYESHVRMSIPHRDGRLVLLPAGTEIRLSLRESDSGSGSGQAPEPALRARVIDRRTGEEGGLFIAFDSHPGNIGKALRKPKKSIAIMSGKGGVGKTVLAINLAVTLARAGRQIVLADADFGAPNIGTLLNCQVLHDLRHLLETGAEPFGAIQEGPFGLRLLLGDPPRAGSGKPITQRDAARLVLMLMELEDSCDMVLVDAGRGLASAEGDFLVPVGKAIVVTTPEPHAITDAYCLLRRMAAGDTWTRIGLVVNMAETQAEADSVANKMRFAARRFLDCELTYLGYVPADSAVKKSIREQVAVVDRYPRTRAAGCIAAISERLCDEFLSAQA